MAESVAEKIAKLEARERELALKLKALKVQKRGTERKADARRKILVGTAVITAVRAEVMSEELLGEVLDQFITKPSDRVFLGLDEAENEKT